MLREGVFSNPQRSQQRDENGYQAAHKAIISPWDGKATGIRCRLVLIS
jgi:hypothetical protein